MWYSLKNLITQRVPLLFKGFMLKTFIYIPFLWFIIFCLLPIFIIFTISFADYLVAVPPYQSVIGWINSTTLQITCNLQNFYYIFKEPMYLKALINSFFIALVSTLILLIISYPLAYAISLSRYKHLLALLIVLPFWTSFLIRVYAWINLLSPQGLINKTLMHWQVIATPILFLNNIYAVIFGIVYSYLPFMVLPIYVVLEKLDRSMLEAAWDLGARPLKTFFTITLPLTYSGMITGSILVFVPALGEVVIPNILGNSGLLVIGKVLWREFFNNHNWPLTCALSLVLLSILIVPVLLLSKLTKRAKYV